jgi:hypothetical protein
MGVVQQTAPLNRLQKLLAKRSLKNVRRDFDSQIKSEFSSWIQELKTSLPYYKFKFDQEEDKISQVKGVLKDKALC